jgi:hypothetical protein
MSTTGEKHLKCYKSCNVAFYLLPGRPNLLERKDTLGRAFHDVKAHIGSGALHPAMTTISKVISQETPICYSDS